MRRPPLKMKTSDGCRTSALPNKPYHYNPNSVYDDLSLLLPLMLATSSIMCPTVTNCYYFRTNTSASEELVAPDQLQQWSWSTMKQAVRMIQNIAHCLSIDCGVFLNILFE